MFASSKASSTELYLPYDTNNIDGVDIYADQGGACPLDRSQRLEGGLLRNPVVYVPGEPPLYGNQDTRNPLSKALLKADRLKEIWQSIQTGAQAMSALRIVQQQAGRIGVEDEYLVASLPYEGMPLFLADGAMVPLRRDSYEETAFPIDWDKLGTSYQHSVEPETATTIARELSASDIELASGKIELGPNFHRIWAEWSRETQLYILQNLPEDVVLFPGNLPYTSPATASKGFVTEKPRFEAFAAQHALWTTYNEREQVLTAQGRKKSDLRGDGGPIECRLTVKNDSFEVSAGLDAEHLEPVFRLQAYGGALSFYQFANMRARQLHWAVRDEAIPDSDKIVVGANLLLIVGGSFAALTASSPFLHGKPTGLKTHNPWYLGTTSPDRVYVTKVGYLGSIDDWYRIYLEGEGGSPEAPPKGIPITADPLTGGKKAGELHEIDYLQQHIQTSWPSYRIIPTLTRDDEGTPISRSLRLEIRNLDRGGPNVNTEMDFCTVIYGLLEALPAFIEAAYGDKNNSRVLLADRERLLSLIPEDLARQNNFNGDALGLDGYLNWFDGSRHTIRDFFLGITDRLGKRVSFLEIAREGLEAIGLDSNELNSTLLRVEQHIKRDLTPADIILAVHEQLLPVCASTEEAANLINYLLIDWYLESLEDSSVFFLEQYDRFRGDIFNAIDFIELQGMPEGSSRDMACLEWKQQLGLNLRDSIHARRSRITAPAPRTL